MGANGRDCKILILLLPPNHHVPIGRQRKRRVNLDERAKKVMMVIVKNEKLSSKGKPTTCGKCGEMDVIRELVMVQETSRQ
ncbi:hypothetical protein Tco_0040637, partial [Tanacetum coccineum]